jgi:hypothetical protein
MKIKMLKTVRGAVDHIHVTDFVQGREYVVTDDFGKLLIGEKWAEDSFEKPAKGGKSEPAVTPKAEVKHQPKSETLAK